MDRIVVQEDPELTRQFPGRLPCRIEIVAKNGDRKTASVDYPRGHYQNPMSDDEIDNKFRSHARRSLPEARIDPALATLWQIDVAKDLHGVFAAVRSGE